MPLSVIKTVITTEAEIFSGGGRVKIRTSAPIRIGADGVGSDGYPVSANEDFELDLGTGPESLFAVSQSSEPATVLVIGVESA